MGRMHCLHAVRLACLGLKTVASCLVQGAERKL